MDTSRVTTDAPAPIAGGAPTPDGVEAFLGSGGVAGLLFTASWCAAGVLLERHFAEGASSSKVPLVFVDCESFPHLADRFQVRSLPTFVLMRGEREEGRLLGAFSGEQVRSLLERPALDRSAVKGSLRSAGRTVTSAPSSSTSSSSTSSSSTSSSSTSSSSAVSSSVHPGGPS